MDKFTYSSTLLLLLLLLQVSILVSADFNLSTIPFSKGFSPLFGEGNIVTSADDLFVQLRLNQFTGSGFKSSELYNYGFFSAKIKLPSDYTAGIVVAFYTTNGDLFLKTHDELDFEFLGNIGSKSWRFQTNMYGNGSTSRGREERYYLWFDPTKEFHRYSILWTPNIIIFFIDDIPIREIVRSEAMGADFPAKPMALYATIWDASDWATSGGKYKVNYKYAPFVTKFTDLILHGRAINPLQQIGELSSIEYNDYTVISKIASITTKQKAAMKKFRSKYMYYSYCYDLLRYSSPLPECVIDPVLRSRFKNTGRLVFNEKRHHRMIIRREKVGVRNKGNLRDAL